MRHVKAGKPFAIFDLDGCLFDDAWRLNKIDWKNRKFGEYHDAMSQDKRTTITGGTLLSIIVGCGIPVVFFTAGPTSHYPQNVSRIKRLTGLNVGEYYLSCRRDFEEGVPSADLKEQMFNDFCEEYKVSAEDCLIAVDDHWGVVERYSQIGLPSFVCNDKQFIWSRSAAFTHAQLGAPSVHSLVEPIDGIDVVIPGVGESAGRNENMRIPQDALLKTFTERLMNLHGRSTLNLERPARVIVKPHNHGNRSDNRVPMHRNGIELKIIPGKDLEELKRMIPSYVLAHNAIHPNKKPAVELSLGYDSAPFSDVEPWEGNQDGAKETSSVPLAGRRMPTKTAGDILSEAAETFKERNAMYKDNAFIHSKIMAAMFPNGVTLKTEEDYHMWHLFELLIVKLSRFSNSGLKHQDSIRDLAVYAAMCETLVDTHDIFENKS